MTEIRIYPTFEGTFLMTHESYPDKKLIHFDKNGNILVEQNYATS